MYVCTDSKEIQAVCELYNIQVILTPDCKTGTDRVARCAERNLQADWIINVQGDEPFANPDDILKVLAPHMVCPKASTFSDLELVKGLKTYDNIQSFTISDLSIGEFFKIPNGKSFVKGE